MQLLSERLHDDHFNSARKTLQELCQSTAKCCEEVGMVIRGGGENGPYQLSLQDTDPKNNIREALGTKQENTSESSEKEQGDTGVFFFDQAMTVLPRQL